MWSDGPFQNTEQHEAGSRLDRRSLLDQSPGYKHMEQDPVEKGLNT